MTQADGWEDVTTTSRAQGGWEDVETQLSQEFHKKQRNIDAFLKTLRAAEGTDSPEGYKMIFGGSVVQDDKDHPRTKRAFVDSTGGVKETTAAGAYQFLERTWDRLRDKLKLKDFSPQSQDLAALELIKEAGAMQDIEEGRIDQAVKKVGPIWASLPTSPYPQPKRDPTFILSAYQKAGGELAEHATPASQEPGWEDVAVAKERVDFLHGMQHAGAVAAEVAGQVLLPIPELVVGGLGAIGEFVHDRSIAYIEAFKNKLSGGPFWESLDKELERLAPEEGGLNKLWKEMAPQSAVGKFAFEKLGDAINAGLNALHGRVKEQGLLSMLPPNLQVLRPITEAALGPPTTEERETEARLAREIAEIGVMLGPVAASVARGKGKIEAQRALNERTREQILKDIDTNVAQAMQKWFPETWARMSQADVGKVDVGVSVREATRLTITKNLEALGVTPTDMAGRDIRQLSEMLLEKADAGEGGSKFNAVARLRIVDAFMKQLEVAEAAEAAAAAKKKPAGLLPAPSPVPGVVEVTPSGRAATPAQRETGRRTFEQLTNEQRAEVLGVGPMGELRAAVESWQRAAREGNEKGVAEARVAMEKKWEQAFPLTNRPGISKQQRTRVMDEWLEKGAPWEPWETIASRVYARPRRKQAGIVELPNIPNILGEAGEQAKKAPLGAGAASSQQQRFTGPAEEAAFRKVDNIFDEGFRRVEEQNKNVVSRFFTATRDKVVDSQGTLKSSLRAFGDMGQEVVNRLNVTRGATMRAKFHFDKEAAPIFRDISTSEKRMLDKLVRARIEIDAYRRRKNYQGIASLGELESWVRRVAKEDINLFQKIDRKADQIFTLYRDKLNRLRDHGLISADKFLRLYNFDYLPKDYVKILDPEAVEMVRGTPVTVTPSGLPHKPGAHTGPAVLDSKFMLAEHIARVENQIMRNEAAGALYKFAKENANRPDMKFVEVVPVKQWDSSGKAKGVYIPPDHVKIPWWDKGKERVMSMDAALGEQWLINPVIADVFIADLARIVSGSSLVKTLATSYNPLFPVSGLPMDALHIYLAGKGYSPHLPVFMGQMAIDIATVGVDSIRRGPRYKQALEEGMGFDFMTHYGRDFTMGRRSLGEHLSPKWEKTKTVLSWVNQTAEIMMRLAHRERLIKSGRPSWEATAIARDRLDFSQGGAISKWADTVVPYSNVAVQAWRSAIREAKEGGTARTAAKLTWATGAIMGLIYWQASEDPEGWGQIPTYDKINNINIRMPMLDYVDSEGNRRAAYFPLRIDNTLSPLMAMSVAAVERALYGKVSTDLLSSFARSLPSLLGNFTVPTIDFLYKYSTGVDPRTEAPFYSGIRVPPELEYKGAAFARPTSEIAKALGMVGMSPADLERAAKSVVPSNPYVSGISALFNLAFSQVNPSVRTKMTQEMLDESGLLRRVVKYTHPASKAIMQIDEHLQKYGKEVKPIFDVADEYAIRYLQGEIKKEQIEAWVTTQPDYLQQSLGKRVKEHIVVETVMKRLHASEGVPPRVWWMKLSNAPAKVRAELYFNEWISREPNERKRMELIVQGLSKNGVGFNSDEFRAHLGRQVQRYTSEQR